MTRMAMVAAAALALAGCAVLRGGGPKGPTPESELNRGAAALHAQDFAAVRDILEPLYRAHYMDATGQRALLLLTAADLDPRNETRRLDAASDYSSMLLNVVDSTSWHRPLAETLYLLSIELGAHEAELDRAEAAKQQAQQTAAALRRQVDLPKSTRESWPAQVRKVQADRDALSKRVDQLQASLKAKDKELTDAKQELERIKKTLKIK